MGVSLRLTPIRRISAPQAKHRMAFRSPWGNAGEYGELRGLWCQGMGWSLWNAAMPFQAVQATRSLTIGRVTVLVAGMVGGGT